MNEQIKINMEHYKKVRKERIKQGLNVSDLITMIENHELICKKIREKSSNKIFYILCVDKVYDSGYYIRLTMRKANNDVLVMMFYENVNSVDKDILLAIENGYKFENFYEILD